MRGGCHSINDGSSVGAGRWGFGVACCWLYQRGDDQDEKHQHHKPRARSVEPAHKRQTSHNMQRGAITSSELRGGDTARASLLQEREHVVDTGEW